VPVHMVDRIRQLYRTTHEMEQKLGRLPTTNELAESLGVLPNKVDWMLRVSWLPLSLESPINGDEDDSELGMFVEDKITPTPIQSAYSKLLKEKVEECWIRSRRASRAYYGCASGWKTARTTPWKRWVRNLA